MDIIIHSEGFSLYDKMREQIEGKIAKIEHFEARAVRARVTLKRLSAHPSPTQFAASIHVEMPGNDAIAEQKASAPIEAVDLVLEKIEHQLSKKKTEKLARRTRVPGLAEAEAEALAAEATT